MGYVKLPALELDAGDYVRVHGVWYKLIEREGEGTRRYQQWLLVDKQGGRRHWPARIGEIVHAYKA